MCKHFRRTRLGQKTKQIHAAVPYHAKIHVRRLYWCTSVCRASEYTAQYFFSKCVLCSTLYIVFAFSLGLRSKEEGFLPGSFLSAAAASLKAQRMTSNCIKFFQRAKTKVSFLPYLLLCRLQTGKKSVSLPPSGRKIDSVPPPEWSTRGIVKAQKNSYGKLTFRL